MDAPTTVTYNGHTYRRYPDSPRRSHRVYYQRRVPEGIIYLHREIYTDANGKIPPKHHIHHKDGNSLNNDPANLECLPEAVHLSMHSKDRDREDFLALQKLGCEAAKEWHGSPEGKAWHSEHSKDLWRQKVGVQKTCECCNNSYLSFTNRQSDRFCSTRCKTKSRVPNDQRKCLWCGKEFVCFKSSKQATCSISCRNLYRYRIVQKNKE